MSLLSMLQGVADTIGLSRPNAIVSSTDGNVRTLLALAQTEGQELLEVCTWPVSQAEATHTTVAAELQGAMEDIAPGFNYIVNTTLWDRTLQQRVSGPLDATEWQLLKARVQTGPYASFRIQGGNLYAYPAPPAGHTWAFEYQTTYFCQSSGGTNQSAWAADDDVGIFDENLMEMGVVWRFKKKNGLDYSEDYRIYQQKLANKMARAGGRRNLSMNSEGPGGTTYVPEGSWPV